MSNIHDEIIDILTPVIGLGLARTAVSTQCKKMGILPEELSKKKKYSRIFRKIRENPGYFCRRRSCIDHHS
jgi:hypothetical protein